MKKKWERRGRHVNGKDGSTTYLADGWAHDPVDAAKWGIDRLIADANWAAEHQAEHTAALAELQAVIRALPQPQDECEPEVANLVHLVCQNLLAEHERVLAENGRMVAAIKAHRDGSSMLDFASRAETAYPCQKEHRALLDAAGLPDEEPAEPGPSNEELREQTGKMLAACEGVLGVLNKIEKGEDA